MSPESLLISASAAVILLLGLAHLFVTYFGPKLRPRDPDLEAGMKATSPHISRQTTMWKAWVGFNASHSLGALLFGVVFSYLALAGEPFFFESPFLVGLGLLTLVCYSVLARLYWFHIPFRGILLSLFLYVAGLYFAYLS